MRSLLHLIFQFQVLWLTLWTHTRMPFRWLVLWCLWAHVFHLYCSASRIEILRRKPLFISLSSRRGKRNGDVARFHCHFGMQIRTDQKRKILFSLRWQTANESYLCKDTAVEISLISDSGKAGSKIQVTSFHRSRVQITAPSINYQTAKIPLDLMEHFVKRLGLGDAFNAIHLFVSWWPVLWPVEKWLVF